MKENSLTNYINYVRVQYIIFFNQKYFSKSYQTTLNIFHNFLNCNIKYITQALHVTEVVKKTSV